MGRKLPKGCRDWHEDLIRCTEARYIRRAHANKRDYAQWMKARDLLRASQDHIFIQPTGENKGAVIGIPKKIGPAITQYLHLVVREEKPVIAPEDEAFMNNIVRVVDQDGQQLNEARPQPVDLGFERGPWMERRRYRDSAYAVMAAMYSLLRPDVHHQVKTSQVEAEMRHFTDHDIRYDYRNRKQGAFKAMDQLVDMNLVYRQQGMGFGGGNFYSLTQRGLKVCHQLFHVKFTPEVSAAYARVRPRCGQCEANAQGQIQMGQGGGPGGVAVGQPVGQLVAGGAAGVGLEQPVMLPRRPVAGGGASWEGGNMHGFDLGVGLADHGGDEGHWDDDKGMGHHGEFGGHGGHGGHVSPTFGRKRSVGDLYGAGNDGGYGGGYGVDGPADYALDADHVRRKRLQKFESTLDGSRGSSSTVKVPPFGAGVKAEDLTGGAGTGAGMSDSQDPELEVVRLQTLLEYTEAEAAREERRRQEEQALEEMQMQLALEDSDRAARREEEEEQELLRLQAEYGHMDDDGDAASEQSVYDLDYEPPADVEGVEEERYGSEEEDEDYRRAVQESLKAQQLPAAPALTALASAGASTSAIPSSSSTAVVPAPVPLTTPATVYRRGSIGASTGIDTGTCRPAPEVIDLDGIEVGTDSALTARPVRSPRAPAVRSQQLEVVDITGTEVNSAGARAAGTTTRTEASAHRSPDPEVMVLDAAEAAASLRRVTGRRRADSLSSQDTRDTNGTFRSRQSIASGSRAAAGPPAPGPVPGQRNVIMSTPLLSPLVEELSSGTPPPRRNGTTSALPPGGASALQTNQVPQPREVICLDESQSQSQSQMMAEICSEEVEWLGLSGGEDSRDGIAGLAGRRAQQRIGTGVQKATAVTGTGANGEGSNSGDSGNSSISTSTGRGMGLAMLAAFASQTRTASTPPGSQPARGSYASPQRVTLPRISTAALAVSPSGPGRGVLSCPMPVSAIPDPGRRQLVMLVDTRERREQNRYRQFFFDIRQRCSNHLPPSPFATATGIPGPRSQGSSSSSAPGHPLDWHIEQEELALGDVAFAYEVPVTAVGAASAQPGSQQQTERYLTGTMVERKALGDLISSSAGDTRERCGTARHVTQERRLRHSGLNRPFMLIEGITNTAALHTAPLVWRDDDRSNPDVIATPEGIVSYMAAVVSRNYAPQRSVTVLQTMNNGTTAVLYAALMAVELVRTATGTASLSASGPRLTDFHRYCTSLGGDKRGLEAQLRRDLLLSAPPTAWVALNSTSSSSSGSGSGAGSAVLTVGAEMVERVVRRFGTWDALLDAYRLCYSAAWPLSRSVAGTALAEMRCALLLCELTVGGTCLDRDNLTVPPGRPMVGEQSGEGDGGEGMSRWESALVWLTARQKLGAQGFLPSVDESRADGSWAGYIYGALRMAQPRRKTRVDMSGSMIATYMSGHSVLDRALFTVDATFSATLSPQRGKTSAVPGGTASYLAHSDQRSPCMHLQSVDATEYTLSSQDYDVSGGAGTVLQRRSQQLCVAVVSGYDVVEELVLATDAYLAALPGGPVAGNIFADPSHSVPIVRSAMIGLCRRLPSGFTASRCAISGAPVQSVLVVESLVHPTSAMASAMGRLSRAVNSSGSQGDPTVRLGDGRPELPAGAAREVSANEVWLVQLFLACASIFGASGGGADGTQESLEEGTGAGWQCLLSPSAEQTERLLYALVHETHRQALLLY